MFGDFLCFTSDNSNVSAIVSELKIGRVLYSKLLWYFYTKLFQSRFYELFYSIFHPFIIPD